MRLPRECATARAKAMRVIQLLVALVNKTWTNWK